MRRSVRMALAAVAMTVAVTAAMTGTGSAAAAYTDSSMVPDQYRVVALGSLGGSGWGDALALNDRGDVVGFSATASGFAHPFLWRDGVMTDLGVLDPTVSDVGQATDINDRGEVVGMSAVAGAGYHAVLWRNGTIVDLGTLGGQNSVAYSINNRSEIVGAAELPTGLYHSFRWADGVMTDLGPVRAYSINDRGQITGGMPVPDGDHAYRWWQGTFTDLGTTAGNYSEGRAINQAGWVTGDSISLVSPPGWGFSGAFLWRNGVMLALPNPGGDGSNAYAINDHGLILGTSFSIAYGSHDVIWQDGTMIDVREHGIAPTGVLLGAGSLRDIDNSARIAGNYYFTEGLQSPVLYTR